MIVCVVVWGGGGLREWINQFFADKENCQIKKKEKRENKPKNIVGVHDDSKIKQLTQRNHRLLHK